MARPRPRATALALAATMAGPVVAPAPARAEPPPSAAPSSSASPQAAPGDQKGDAASVDQTAHPNGSVSEPTEPASTPSTPHPTAAHPPAPAALTPALAPVSSAPAPATSETARAVVSPGEAFVHVAVSYRGAWLETRSAVDGGDFERACAAPCDRNLPVEGMEARVVAPGMTSSNVFRFEAGAGVASLRVDGGSAIARRAGIITLVAGIPVALAGMGLYAQGRVKEQKGLQVAGIVGLAAGGLSVAVSLPLLLKGTTDVKNAKGSLIALAPFSPSL